MQGAILTKPIINSSRIFARWCTLLLYELDRQCTYNVTLTRVHAIIVALEKQYVLREFVFVA